MLKSYLRKILPPSAINSYHLALAKLAAVVYRHPSDKLIVIGITGTSGKSTTVAFLGQILEQAGYRVGWISTVSVKIAEKEEANTAKMTMFGRLQLQKRLAEMVKAGCTYAIVETSSQGIVQHRHVGINYDLVLLTNLRPEHIESHGGFENYKQAKMELFRHLTRRPRKMIGGKRITKTIVVNGRDPHANDFLACAADRKIAFEVDEDVEVSATGSTFIAFGVEMELPLLGRFNVENALAAATAAMALDVPIPTIQAAVATLRGVPGRLERIDEGQAFTVMVDFAFEPGALQKIFETLTVIPYERLIHVFGSCGGGRDVARRPVLGRMSGETADISIVTNEDPYDDDPMQIIHDVADGVRQTGKKEGEGLRIIADRAEAIQTAINLAQPGDLVLITGKGSEPVMAVGHGQLIPWDDREQARAALRKRG